MNWSLCVCLLRLIFCMYSYQCVKNKSTEVLSHKHVETLLHNWVEMWLWKGLVTCGFFSSTFINLIWKFTWIPFCSPVSFQILTLIHSILFPHLAFKCVDLFILNASDWKSRWQWIWVACGFGDWLERMKRVSKIWGVSTIFLLPTVFPGIFRMF